MDPIVGINLKAWRLRLGFSQEKIAEYLGISRENISYFENGEREIPVKHLEKICELYGIDTDLLYDEDSNAQEAEMAFAFRNDDGLSIDSLKSIAHFKKIVRNYLMMDSKL